MDDPPGSKKVARNGYRGYSDSLRFSASEFLCSVGIRSGGVSALRFPYVLLSGMQYHNLFVRLARFLEIV